MAGLIGVQVFTASGTYTPTAGTVSIFIEALGGGGGGGGAAATTALVSAGGGGGAGAYALGRVTSGFSGVTVTIGAAGAAASAGANTGGNGGNTTFDSVLTAGGGLGGTPFGPTGTPNAAYGGGGGTASGSACLVAAVGAIGDTAYAVLYTQVSGGMGGSTIYGGGGLPEENGNSDGGGIATTGYGSGGGGGANAGDGVLKAAKTGFAGAPGLMIIWEYA